MAHCVFSHNQCLNAWLPSNIRNWSHYPNFPAIDFFLFALPSHKNFCLTNSFQIKSTSLVFLCLLAACFEVFPEKNGLGYMYESLMAQGFQKQLHVANTTGTLQPCIQFYNLNMFPFGINCTCVDSTCSHYLNLRLGTNSC